MRSIRRSLLGYLLLLLALALGAVGVFVDRFAIDAIRAREESETRRMEREFDLRRLEAQKKFDAELVSETKALARELHPKLNLLLGLPPDRFPQPPPRQGEAPGRMPDAALRASDQEVEDYRLRLTLLQLVPDTCGWQAAMTAQAIEPPPVVLPPGAGSRILPRSPPGDLPRVSPLWIGYDSPRGLLRIQESLRKLFDDDEHPGYFQFDIVANYPGLPGHVVATTRSARLGHDLPPVDPNAVDRNTDPEYEPDDVEVPQKGSFRRVIKIGGRPWLGFPVRFSTPPPIATGRVANRPPDIFFRVYVQHARPQSELFDRLELDQRDKDEQLGAVRRETREELLRLRARLSLIGCGTFAALVVGGWLIVARGLAPMRKLSDAVSMVSERDFRLPVGPEELGRELAPIHARLTQTFDLLRRAFEREKQSVADISHELRTPVASLLATIDVTLRKPRTQEQYRVALEDCRGIARQLGQLVERIMTLASLDAGNAGAAIVEVDAAQLADECAAVIRPLAEAHGLTFHLRIEEPVRLASDPDMLREVLMNLLHNAVEYNRPGGRVELRVRRNDRTVAFEVEDSGIGMADGVREKIFERFYRADPSRHSTGVHAGLGLAIVREYVGRLNGTIDVESQSDRGSTFRVSLEAALESPAVEPASPVRSVQDDRSNPRPRGRPARLGT